MGALAVDYVNQPVNTTSGWAGQGKLGETVPTNNPVFKADANTIKQTALGAISEKALKSTATRSNAWLFGAKTAYDIGVALKEGYDAGTLKIPEALSNLFSTADFTMAQQDALSQNVSSILAPLSEPVASGETLPSVMKQNTSAIVQSLNLYTSTFSSKLDYLNTSLMGLLTYMDIVVDYMEKGYTLNKELSDKAEKLEENNSVQVGDTKMTPAEIEARKNFAMFQAYSFKTSPVSSSILEATNLSGMSPLEIEVSKNSYVVEANEFAKVPVDFDILNADSVVGMSPREIEVSHRSNEVEARVYARNPVSVKDWDENVLADIAPREAELVKNATLAKDTTDKINFSLDEDGNLDEESKGVDFSSILGYSGDTEIIKEVFTRLGGQGL